MEQGISRKRAVALATIRVGAQASLASIPAMIAASLASWCIWFFWHDVPPPVITVPVCHGTSDLYVRVWAFKAAMTEYHCFNISDNRDQPPRPSAPPYSGDQLP